MTFRQQMTSLCLTVAASRKLLICSEIHWGTARDGPPNLAGLCVSGFPDLDFKSLLPLESWLCFEHKDERPHQLIMSRSGRWNNATRMGCACSRKISLCESRAATSNSNSNNQNSVAASSSPDSQSTIIIIGRYLQPVPIQASGESPACAII